MLDETKFNERLDDRRTDQFYESMKEEFVNVLPDDEEEYLDMFVSEYDKFFSDKNFVDYERENGKREFFITVLNENGEADHQIDASPFEYALYQANLKETYPHKMAALSIDHLNEEFNNGTPFN